VSRSAVAPALLLGAFAAVLAPRLFAAGWEMDEGAVLAYAVRILGGAVPMRDFQTFYGPLNAALVALVFKVAGPSLIAERLVGFAYRLVLAGALFRLVHRRGVAAIGVCAAILGALLPGQGVVALASYGSLACACVALALADARRQLLAGVAAGLAVLMRFDWVLPVALAALPYLWVAGWRARRRAALGFAIGAGAYLPYLVAVGPDKVRLMMEQLRATEPGRRLPLPQQWDAFPGYVLAAMLGAIVLLAVLGVRRRRSAEGLTFAAVALLGVGLVPSALARADGVHIVASAVAPVALLAAAVPAAWEDIRPLLGRVRPSLRLAVLAAASAGALSVAAPWALAGRYGAMLRLDDFPSYTVSHDGRSFRLANSGYAQDAERALRRADALARPGDRLFVGPADLRRTNYADTYLYYLLPRLRPATFYMELNPHTANRPDSGLAEDVRRANILILSTAYDFWLERNSSREYGSPVPNRIVRHRFCARGTYGFFRVLERCRP
jgi:branched-subunit amino acid transport protein